MTEREYLDALVLDGLQTHEGAVMRPWSRHILALRKKGLVSAAGIFTMPNTRGHRRLFGGKRSARGLVRATALGLRHCSPSVQAIVRLHGHSLVNE